MLEREFWWADRRDDEVSRLCERIEWYTANSLDVGPDGPKTNAWHWVYRSHSGEHVRVF